MYLGNREIGGAMTMDPAFDSHQNDRQWSEDKTCSTARQCVAKDELQILLRRSDQEESSNPGANCACGDQHPQVTLVLYRQPDQDSETQKQCG